MVPREGAPPHHEYEPNGDEMVACSDAGSMVIIGGRKTQGKYLVLGTIMVALGETKYADEKMVENGKKASSCHRLQNVDPPTTEKAHALNSINRKFFPP